ncbi:uncharacterized protein BDZ99DRAFT_513253 [Mytilinidion resinicola]|uniref:ATP synthase protein 8 n=1 Tax=Mytilinidion resinicola TaxID=574789 RepID=A0A6A6Z862_9PEZI|nr:uncharacterized protein BDZ99DRAFT_513253 [Mytilinidion resinicola]KAF2816988.1 hypothetical protein BDZ99DRAFT_513253 [Mytilinidion resinicola]
MNSTRVFRPLARAMQHQPGMLHASTIARPTLAATQIKAKQTETPAKPAQGLMMYRAAMPQLVPFFFVNETTVAFIALPALIYVFSKYILPAKVRTQAARLFISKL